MFASKRQAPQKGQQTLPAHAADKNWRTKNHLYYTCKHAKMVATVTEGIAKMEKTLAAESMLQGVAFAFVKRVRKTTGTLTDKRQLQCNAAKSARAL